MINGLLTTKKFELKVEVTALKLLDTAFEAGYKAGFVAADNGDSDEYYKLMKGEVI